MTAITPARAKEAAAALLEEMFPGEADGYEILADVVDAGELGLVVFFDSKAYLATGALSRKVVGNAPIVVGHDGTARFTGTAAPLDTYLDALRTGKALE